MTILAHPQVLILQSINAILTGDSVLAALVGSRIYSNTPKNTTYPYVKFGSLELGEWDTHTWVGFTGTLQVSAWDQSESQLPIMNIANRLYSLLHTKDLNLQGYSMINFRCTLNKILEEPDSRTYQALQRYSITIGGN